MCTFNTCWYEEVCDGAKQDCYKSCVRYHEMKYMMDNSNIPKNRQLPSMLQPDECDLAAFSRLAEIKEDIVNFVEDGRNLYITSSITGNGKSSWSLKLILKYFDSMWDGNGFVPRGVFIHVPTFLLKCKDFKNEDPEFEDLKRRLLDVDLVVWDDIASTAVTGYDISQMLMYIDSRVFSGRANIYTGNIVNRDSMEKMLGTKLVSRIWGSGTEIIEFRGGDRR